MPKMIELVEARELIEGGAQLVDVLSRKEFENSRLPGAIHVSLHELDEQSTSSLARDRPVVVYCYDYQ